MKPHTLMAAAVVLSAPLGAIAQTSAHPYSDFVSRVQQKLLALGFNAGPANGDLGAETQAALAQFQLSRAIPAGGQLDEQTLAELGVERERREAAAGSSAAPQPDSAADRPETSSPAQKPGS